MQLQQRLQQQKRQVERQENEKTQVLEAIERKKVNNDNDDYSVAIVFSKPLLDDQITIEYASRLAMLARSIQDGSFRPDLICLCGTSATSSSSSFPVIPSSS